MPFAILIFLLLLHAVIKRVDVFTAFRNGASEALPLVKTLLPTLAVFVPAMRLLRMSGAEAWLCERLSPVLAHVGIDARLVPLLIVRPVSGSAAVAALTELFSQYGPDSDVGMRASVLLGSSETVFYTLALYFGSVKIRKTRFAVPVALAALFVSIVTGLLFSTIFFGSR